MAAAEMRAKCKTEIRDRGDRDVEKLKDEGVAKLGAFDLVNPKRCQYTEGRQSCGEGCDQQREITSGKRMKETPRLGKL